MSIDLSKINTIEELNDVIRQAHGRIGELKNLKRVEARAQALAILSQHGFTAEEIFGAGGKKARAKTAAGVAKYRNPSNGDQTWTGRGKRPQWFRDALDSGRTADSMLIG